MKQTAEDKAREERIGEITADANDMEEVMMGWFYYLDDGVTFPFEAECIEENQVSPLRKGEKVIALELISGEDSGNDFFVRIECYCARSASARYAKPSITVKSSKITPTTSTAPVA
jgi:hypothetical protein